MNFLNFNLIDKLFFDICIPLLFITRKEDDIWRNDPSEFIRKEDDFSHFSNDYKNVALDFIERICKEKDS